MNEISENTLFFHLTFGLLDGWWLYEDASLRIPGCPILSGDSWQKVLSEQGFDSVTLAAEESRHLGQHIIIARNKGDDEPPFLGSTDKLISKTIIEKNATAQQGVNVSVETDAQELELSVRQIVTQKVSEALHIDVKKIDHDESFADYGIDSITGVNLVKGINEALGTGLKTTILFDYSSVHLLTTAILSKYPDKIASLLKTNPLSQKIVSLGKEQETESFSEAPSSVIQNSVSVAGLAQPQIEYTYQPIAIIGMSGRYAQSNNVDILWDHLAAGDNLIEPVSRWDLSQYYERDDYCDYGSFLKDIDRFDALFFNISGAEASYMDPQQRLFLEEAWKTLEDAGYAGNAIKGKQCGVYVGWCGGIIQDYLVAGQIGHNCQHKQCGGIWGLSFLPVLLICLISKAQQ